MQNRIVHTAPKDHVCENQSSPPGFAWKWSFPLHRSLHRKTGGCALPTSGGARHPLGAPILRGGRVPRRGYRSDESLAAFDKLSLGNVNLTVLSSGVRLWPMAVRCSWSMRAFWPLGWRCEGSNGVGWMWPMCRWSEWMVVKFRCVCDRWFRFRMSSVRSCVRCAWFAV